MKLERPIYRIETESLVLRPWREDEVEVLSALILANLEHLRRWLPWANYEPEPRDEKLDRIRRSLVNFKNGEKCAYGIYESVNRRLLGCVGLETTSDVADRFADPDRAGEIGYWLDERSCGLGIMTVSVAAVTHVAFEAMGLCHLETLPNHTSTPKGEPRDSMIWVMDEGGYKASPAAALTLLATSETETN